MFLFSFLFSSFLLLLYGQQYEERINNEKLNLASSNRTRELKDIIAFRKAKYVEQNTKNQIIHMKMIQSELNRFRYLFEIPRYGWSRVIKSLIRTETVINSAAAHLIFIDHVEHFFMERKRREDVLHPWIGVLHFVGNPPADVPVKWRPWKENMKTLFETDSFLTSLRRCKALVTLSPTWRAWLANHPKIVEHKIPIYGFKQPIVSSGLREFSMEEFGRRAEDSKRQLILLGQQYVRLANFMKLEVPYEKVWLPEVGSSGQKRMKGGLETELLFEGLMDPGGVRMVQSLANKEYYSMLRRGIVLIDVWTASVHPELLDCIKLNIPVLARRVSGLEDYLGQDYPLYFDGFSDLQDLLRDEAVLIQKMRDAHLYLKYTDKSDLALQKFTNRIVNLLTQISSLTPVDLLPTTPHSVLVVVPGHGDVRRSPILLQSLEQLQRSYKKAGVPFRCLIFVYKKELLEDMGPEMKSLQQMCKLEFSQGYWTDHMLKVPIVTTSHVIVLLDDIKLGNLDGPRVLRDMDKYGFQAASAALQWWHYPAMRFRQGCEVHRTDYIDIVMAFFTRDTWTCWQSKIDLSVNQFGWGYDVTLATLCNARVGVIDSQVVEHAPPSNRRLSSGNDSGYSRLLLEDSEYKNRSYSSAEAMKQMYAWIKKAVGPNHDGQAAHFWQVVTTKRPDDHPYCQPPFLTAREVRWVTQLPNPDCLVNRLPTLENPFFFFHIPRSGGTSFRDLIYFAAMSRNISNMIPGVYFPGVEGNWKALENWNHNCIYDNILQPHACQYPDLIACAPVIGGHFGIHLAAAMLAAGPNQHPQCYRGWERSSFPDAVPFKAFSCITMMRDPAERVLSCYKFFKGDEFGPFPSLSAERQKYVIDNCGGELAYLYLGGNPPYTRGPNNQELSGVGGNMTLAKMAIDHCFVGLTSKWDQTLLMAKRFFPWLATSVDRARHRLGTNHSSVKELSGEARELLSKEMVHDFELYRYAEEKFQKQEECFI